MNRRTRLAYIKRLEKLISVFETAKPVKKYGRVIGHTFDIGKNTVLFDISLWNANIGDHYGFTEELKKATSCGTAACVAGTAGLIPEFRKAGLCSFLSDDVILFDKEGHVKSRDLKAFAEFFGISFDQSFNICIPSEYDDNATPSKVLRRLRSILKSKVAELNSL